VKNDEKDFKGADAAEVVSAGSIVPSGPQARRVLTSNLAAMMAIAASAPHNPDAYELRAPPRFRDPIFNDWVSPSRGTPRHRRRNDARAAMAKASRKRNRR
jgi:hypothetical protein